MRLIKQHTTNSRIITGKGFKYDASTDISTIDANGLIVPAGDSSTRPSTPTNGLVRYNSTINEFEFYANNTWQVVRFKEPGLITKQVMTLPDAVHTIFGPLLSNDAAFPEPLSANNILVYVENVFQIAPLNFDMVESPSSTGTGDEISVFYLINGNDYIITAPGNTDYTKVGAANNLQGTIFTADISLEVTQTLTLSNPNGNAGTTTDDFFAYSVAINNNAANSLILIGAYKEDDAQGNEAGKAYIYNLSGTLLHTLDNPQAYGGTTEDLFGFSVAISNTYAAVGAFQEDDTVSGPGADSGKVFLYDITNIQNTPDHIFSNPNEEAGGATNATDWFGYSIDVTDTHLVVGVPKAEGTQGLDTVGNVVVYEFATMGAGPNYNKTIIENPLPTGTWFGSAVAASDNYIIVGTNPIEGNTYNNRVHIFDVAGNHLYILDNPNTATTDDGFGFSVDISERYAIVGAFNEDGGFGNDTNQGSIYIYEIPANPPGAPPEFLTPVMYSNPNWDGVTPEDEFLNNEFGGIDDPNPFGLATDDRFGYKVAISDVYAVVSAHTEDSQNTEGVVQSNSGIVYVFDLLTGLRLADIPNPNGFSTAVDDQFGAAISVSNTQLVVGAYQEDDSSGTTSGKAYVYDIEGKALGTGLVRPTGQYLEFTSPPALNKTITVYHNFDK